MEVVVFILGVLFWTFLEYALHRGLGHKPQLKNPFTKEHMQHHKEVHYFAPAYKKAAGAIVVVGGITFGLSFLTVFSYAFSFALGLTLMYLVYEFVHSYLHTHAPLNSYGAFLRKHHFYHHFNNPDKNHGVTTPFWDVLFGTYEKSEVPIAVPRRAKLEWLLDDKGELKNEYSQSYQLV